MKNILLRQARIARGWSQEDLAERLKVHRTTVNRWEQGMMPERFHQEQMSLLFEKSFMQLGFLSDVTTTLLLDPLIPPLSSVPLIGRDLFTEEIKQRLLQNKSEVQIALHGLPGVGKTAIALALAYDKEMRAHFDGILWAGMGSIANVEGILSRWSTFFGMSTNAAGILNRREVWTRTLRERIGQHRLLILLDDAWNLVDALALKLGGENCAYVLTTRLPALAAEFAEGGASHVTEISEVEGVNLLKILAPGLETINMETVRRLAYSAGGLPLALTLAGKYLHAQSYYRPQRRLQTSLERLLSGDERLSLSQPTTPIEYHPSLPIGSPLSLQTLIAVSDERLDPLAQSTLRALSVFPPKPNTFSEEAAMVVAACTLEALDTLTDAGLLESSGVGRSTLHQTIADYARTHQTDTFPAERLVASITPFVEANRMNHEILEQDRDNILATLDFASALGMQEAFVRIICSFAPFLLLRGLYDQAKVHLLRAYEMLKAVDIPLLTVTCLHHLGMVAQKQGEYKQATEYYQEGLELARNMNDTERICEFLSDLGWVTEKRGLYEQAYAYAQEGLKLAHQINDKTHRSRLLTVLGVIADNRGEYIQAKAYYQEALTIARQMNDREQECVILIDLGVNVSEQGMNKEAMQFQLEALRLARQLSHWEWECLLLINMAASNEEIGEYPQAEAYNQEALSLIRQLGHREWLTYSLRTQGALEMRRNDYAQAEISLQEALTLAHQIEKPIYVCEVLKALGDLAFMQQHVDVATAYFSEMLQRVPDGQQGLKAEVLYRLALIAATKGDAQEAKNLGDAALLILDEIGNNRLSNEIREWVEKGYQPSLPSAF